MRATLFHPHKWVDAPAPPLGQRETRRRQTGPDWSFSTGPSGRSVDPTQNAEQMGGCGRVISRRACGAAGCHGPLRPEMRHWANPATGRGQSGLECATGPIRPRGEANPAWNAPLGQSGHGAKPIRPGMRHWANPATGRGQSGLEQNLATRSAAEWRRGAPADPAGSTASTTGSLRPTSCSRFSRRRSVPRATSAKPTNRPTEGGGRRGATSREAAQGE